MILRNVGIWVLPLDLVARNEKIFRHDWVTVKFFDE